MGSTCLRIVMPMTVVAALASACDRTPTTPTQPPPNPGPTQPAPAVSAIAPASGSSDGGTEILITGTDFRDVRAVQFGSVSAAGWTVESETTIRAVAPGGSPDSDPVHITVRTPGGTSATNDAARYSWEPNRLLDLTLSEASVSGGETLTGTATVTFPAPTGGLRLPIDWSSTPPGSTAVLLPPTVLIPAGSTDGSFLITTFFVSTPAAIDVSTEHWGLQQASFTVTP
jgi:hypothetical protein